MRAAPEVVTLLAGETPPADLDWLMIVKTAGADFEVVISLVRGRTVRTLGTWETFEVASQHALRAAAEFNIASVYKIG